MSIRAIKWAWKVQLPPVQKLVLLALADHANDASQCWPSLTRLQIITGLSRPSIWKSINRMGDAGLVSRTAKHKSGATIYTLGINVTHLIGNHGNMQGNHRDRLGNVGNVVGNDVTPNYQKHKNHKEPDASPKHVLVHLEKLKGAIKRK